MYIVKLSVVIIFSFISLFMAFFSIKKINSFPNSKFSPKGNLGRISLYSSMGAYLDIIMSVIIVCFLGEGEFGTGIELIVFVCTILLYTPWCVISSHRLKKRMKDLGELKIHRINVLNFTAFFKAVFASFATIFFVEFEDNIKISLIMILNTQILKCIMESLIIGMYLLQKL